MNLYRNITAKPEFSGTETCTADRLCTSRLRITARAIGTLMIWPDSLFIAWWVLQVLKHLQRLAINVDSLINITISKIYTPHCGMEILFPLTTYSQIILTWKSFGSVFDLLSTWANVWSNCSPIPRCLSTKKSLQKNKLVGSLSLTGSHSRCFA